MTEEHIRNVLTYVRKRGYANKIDISGDFCRDNMLYYTQIAPGVFIVLNHFNREAKCHLQGFDLWLAKYDENDEPGKGKPNKIESLKLGFKLPADEQYIWNATQKIHHLEL